jgi:hypothetical protein
VFRVGTGAVRTAYPRVARQFYHILTRDRFEVVFCFANPEPGNYVGIAGLYYWTVTGTFPSRYFSVHSISLRRQNESHKNNYTEFIWGKRKESFNGCGSHT